MTDERTLPSSSTDTLRHIADWIEAHPTVPIYGIGMDEDPICLNIYELSTKAEAQAFVHEVGKVKKSIHGTQLHLRHQPEGANFVVDAVFWRNAVCTAKVVGTEEVQEAVPSDETRTVTKNIIEWECGPLMEGEKDE